MQRIANKPVYRSQDHSLFAQKVNKQPHLSITQRLSVTPLATNSHSH